MPQLSVMQGVWAICRLAADTPPPAWAFSGPFVSITRTRDEISIVCPDAGVPEGTKAERGWRVIQAHGPFDFAAVGIIASLAAPLAASDIPIFVISTFDTDYLLVKREALDTALEILERAGHQIAPPPR